jgi:glycosyltransferase involved in cell wall biosynthesis
LLDGYRYEVLENVAKVPSVVQFGGCDTPSVYQKLKYERPDAVLVNGWVVKTCLQTLWACRRLGIPCLVRGEANLLHPRARWKHVIHRLLLKQYQAYLYIGSANREFYRFHGCPEGRLFFAPYSVNNEFFTREVHARVEKRVTLRDSWGIKSDACVFLFVGKLEEKKHPLDMLTAVSLIPHPLRDRVHVLMAGEGPLREAAELSVRQHTSSVTFTGFLNQSRLPDVYAASDVLVLPSDTGETWGLVVNEAMASGRPAIVSRSAGCCPDLIVEGETGFAFDCGDVQGLSAAMMRYLVEPGLAVRQGAAAFRHIQAYSLSRSVDGIIAALNSCVHESDGLLNSR